MSQLQQLNVLPLRLLRSLFLDCSCFSLLNASEQPDSRSAPFTSGCSTSIPHCSVVKLIVGTLYCAEKAYEYGLRTVLESLDPIEKVLNAETW